MNPPTLAECCLHPYSNGLAIIPYSFLETLVLYSLVMIPYKVYIDIFSANVQQYLMELPLSPKSVFYLFGLDYILSCYAISLEH